MYKYINALLFFDGLGLFRTKKRSPQRMAGAVLSLKTNRLSLFSLLFFLSLSSLFSLSAISLYPLGLFMY